MALFKGGPVVQSISGALGGAVFALGKGGAYVRTRGARCNRATKAQGQQRARYFNVVRMWDDLTDAQRLAWASLGARVYRTDRVGTQKVYSGRSLFLRENGLRVRVGMTLLSDPPLLGVRQGFISFTGTYISGTLTLRCNRYSGTGSGEALFYGVRAFSSSGFSAKNFVLYLRSPFTSNLVVNSTTFFANRFGTPVVGELISVRCVAIFDDCLASLPADIVIKRAS